MPRERERSYSPRRNGSGSPRNLRRPKDDRTSLLVRNIPRNSTPDDLREPFERFGGIKDVYLPRDFYTHEPRGFGFIQFHSNEDAAQAQSEMDQTLIGGREITVVYAEETRKRPDDMRHRAPAPPSHRRRSPPPYGQRQAHSPRRRSRSPPYRGRRYERSPPRRFPSPPPRRGRSPPPRSRDRDRDRSPLPPRDRYPPSPPMPPQRSPPPLRSEREVEYESEGRQGAEPYGEREEPKEEQDQDLEEEREQSIEE